MNRSWYRSTALQVLTAASIIATAGACGSDSGVNTGEPALGPRVEPGEMRNFTLPLDAYITAPAVEVLEAENVLVRKCMAEFGFTGEYVGTDSPDSGPPPNERRYWLVSNSDATTLGYHSRWADVAKARSDSTVEWSPAEEALLTGRGPNALQGRMIPKGGCLGEARRTLAMGVPELPTMEGAPVLEDGSGTSVSAIADHLAAGSYNRMLNDSRVMNSVAEWRTCMEGKGFHYESPQNANNDPRWSGDGASEEEIATATADVACKQQTDLVSTMATVETAYQQRELEANAEVLAEVKEVLDTKIKNAQSVLAGG
ncbi:hypothetical protein [Rhodococcus erythropolis]|uniref:hypothetical protein n=1 Tax=Rhodococcus erythropolis TaxID=1833 RepID=UPI001BE5F6B4|nr:hypothetical protein [Rhodococcus erythropolis]MBT2264460.1 hypothetical protein [Rhodococcus erythropolis]